MNTFFIAMLIPAAVGIIALVIHLSSDSGGRASTQSDLPGATRAEVGHRPSRGEPSARAGSLSFPRVTGGPGTRRVL